MVSRLGHCVAKVIGSSLIEVAPPPFNTLLSNLVWVSPGGGALAFTQSCRFYRFEILRWMVRLIRSCIAVKSVITILMFSETRHALLLFCRPIENSSLRRLLFIKMYFMPVLQNIWVRPQDLHFCYKIQLVNLLLYHEMVSLWMFHFEVEKYLTSSKWWWLEIILKRLTSFTNSVIELQFENTILPFKF